MTRKWAVAQFWLFVWTAATLATGAVLKHYSASLGLQMLAADIVSLSSFWASLCLVGFMATKDEV